MILDFLLIVMTGIAAIVGYTITMFFVVLTIAAVIRKESLTFYLGLLGNVEDPENTKTYLSLQMTKNKKKEEVVEAKQ